jgi:dihydroorotate dehydrogenase
VADTIDDGLWPILRALLFRVDAERVHRLSMSALAAWSRVCSVDLLSHDVARDPALATRALGLTFPNPLGLAAGFDKDAECLPAWQALGFGFVEVGTVTALAQPGNDKPRVFRLPRDRGLFNRLGFNNHGARAAADRIAHQRAKHRVHIPIGVNIGKSKAVANEDAAADYCASFVAVADVADYVVMNVSSPNTPGLRDLQAAETLASIVGAVQSENHKRQTPRPLLVKLAPDLALDDARGCAEVARAHGCAGLVVTNTTISRAGLFDPPADGPGGISGAPLLERSTEMLRALASEFSSSLTFIGVGGIETAQHAIDKRAAGAALVQSYTGFVYGGPSWPRRICLGIAAASRAQRSLPSTP